MVLAPVVRGRKGEYGKLLEELRAEGFSRVKVDGEMRQLEEEIDLDKKYKHDISVVVDRLVMRPEVRKRLADSIETAVSAGRRHGRRSSWCDEKEGDGQTGCSRSPRSSPAPSTARRSPSSSRGSSRSTRRTAPARAAPGWARRWRSIPSSIVPDPSLSIGEGAILPWSASSSNYYDEITKRSPSATRSTSRRRGSSSRTTSATCSSTARTATRSTSPTGTGTGASARTRRASRGSCPTSSAATGRPTPTTRARRSRSTCRCARARSAAARACGPSRGP